MYIGQAPCLAAFEGRLLSDDDRQRTIFPSAAHRGHTKPGNVQSTNRPYQSPAMKRVRVNARHVNVRVDC